MSIRIKLQIITVVSVVGLAAVSGFALYSNGMLKEYSSVEIEGHQALIEIKTLNGVLKDFLITQDISLPYNQFIPRLEASDRAINAFLESPVLKKLLTSDDGQTARTLLLQIWAGTVEKCQGIKEKTDTVYSGDLSASKGVLVKMYTSTSGAELFPLYSAINQTLTQFNEAVISQFTILYSEIERVVAARERSITIIFVAVSAAIALFVFFFTITISRNLSASIFTIERGMKAIVEQDLTRELPLRSKDEISRVAGYINNMVLKLKEVIIGIKAAVTESQERSEMATEEIRTMSETIAAISTELGVIREQFASLHGNIDDSSTTVEEITRNIESLAKQIDRQAFSVTETSSSMEEISRSIHSVNDITHNQATVSEKIMNDIDEGRRRTRETNKLIQTTLENAQNIRQVVQIINTIAAQTNLLAMNAAIEAAHSGEYGRGFSVVADEIRKLAESAGKNAKKIQDLIKEVTRNVEAASVSSDEDTEIFEIINERIKDFHQSFQEISGALEEMASGSGQVQETTVELSDITQGIRTGYTEMQAGTGGIARALGSIRDISSQVLERLSTIDGSTDTIVKSVESIVGSQEGTEQNIAALHRKIELFKTDAE